MTIGLVGCPPVHHAEGGDGGTSCTTPDACTSATAPYCDPALGVCRACQIHAECPASLACRNDESLPALVPVGACYLPSQVSMVDSVACETPVDGGTMGSAGNPFCDVQSAVDAGQTLIVVRPHGGGGTYGPVSLAQVQSPITILGPSRDSDPTAVLGGVTVSGSGTVALLADLAIQGDPALAALTCDGAQVRLLRVAVMAGQSGVVAQDQCQITLDRTSVEGAAQAALQVSSDGRYRVLDALFVHNGLTSTDILIDLGSNLIGNVFTYSTLADNQGLIYCGAGQVLANSIIGLPTAGTQAFFNGNCVQEQMYVGAQAGAYLDSQYAPTAASTCCLGKGQPDSSVTVDFDGNPRPAMPDIGCFQYSMTAAPRASRSD